MENKKVSEDKKPKTDAPKVDASEAKKTETLGETDGVSKQGDSKAVPGTPTEMPLIPEDKQKAIVAAGGPEAYEQKQADQKQMAVANAQKAVGEKGHLLDGQIGELGSYDVDFIGGKLVIVGNMDMGGGIAKAGLNIQIDGEKIIDLITSKIPGKVDDYVGQILKAAVLGK